MFTGGDKGIDRLRSNRPTMILFTDDVCNSQESICAAAHGRNILIFMASQTAGNIDRF